jgi:hypothetical protein
MIVSATVERLEDHIEFKQWKKDNKTSYLAHVFKLVDQANKDIWQIGYYNLNDTITTFTIDYDDVRIIPEEAVFKKTDKKVRRLDLSKVKIDLDKALSIAEDFQKNNYKMDDPERIIVILQNVAKNIMYNVTYITKVVNLLNMKIDAKTGNMICHEITPLMQFTGKAG